MNVYVIPVVFVVHADTTESAQAALIERLPRPDEEAHFPIDSWWIATDDRIDGTDNPTYVPKES